MRRRPGVRGLPFPDCLLLAGGLAVADFLGEILMTLQEALYGLEADRHHRRAHLGGDRTQRLALLVHADDLAQHFLLHRILDQTTVGVNQVAEGTAAPQEAALVALALLDGLDPFGGAAF